jgi:hypothetical protein
MYRYGDDIIYGLGSNSNECPSFVSKNIEVSEVDDYLIDSDGIGAL